MTERIAIIGGGASGTLLAAELLRRAERPLDLVLVEPRSTLGRGAAYATPFPVHVLNVPAGRLSAHPSEPGHFRAWLRERDPALDENSFVERRLYGCYLEQVFEQARSAARARVQVDHVADEAVSIASAPGRFEVFLSCAPPFRAERVVLALGNLPPDTLRRLAPDGLDPVRYVRDPWAPAALDFPDPAGDVLVLGTGMTAMDVVLALRHRGHEGRVLAVSRHGLLPREHASPASAAGEAPVSWEIAAPLTLRRLLGEVRAQVRRRRVVGGDVRAVVDSLRPRTQALWRALPPPDRAAFLRHLQPFWDVHRHRMAPEVAVRVRALLETGALRVMAGRVQVLHEAAGAVRAAIRPRGVRRAAVVQVRHVVDATGPAPPGRADHAFLRRLLASGVVRTDALGLGLDVTPDGRVVSLANPRGDQLFAVGPLLKGALWETTAIEEIREQAAQLAGTLLALGTATGASPSLTSSSKVAVSPRGETAGSRR